jgi:hypothetical protein
MWFNPGLYIATDDAAKVKKLLMTYDCQAQVSTMSLQELKDHLMDHQFYPEEINEEG